LLIPLRALFMLKIYHNPRCRKSREALEFINASGTKVEIILYLENILNKEKLKEILDKIKLSPSAILRKNEKEWKEIPSNKTMSEDQILEAMVSKPKLIERPIVVSDNDGVLARPIENLIEYLKKY